MAETVKVMRLNHPLTHQTILSDSSYPFIAVILPVLEEISGDLDILYGSSVTLNCTGSSAEGNVNITWSTSVPGITLPQPTLTPLDENTVTSSVTLDSVSDAYSGVYVCNISNGLASVTEKVSIVVISKYQYGFTKISYKDSSSNNFKGKMI